MAAEPSSSVNTANASSVGSSSPKIDQKQMNTGSSQGVGTPVQTQQPVMPPPPPKPNSSTASTPVSEPVNPKTNQPLVSSPLSAVPREEGSTPVSSNTTSHNSNISSNGTFPSIQTPNMTVPNTHVSSNKPNDEEEKPNTSIPNIAGIPTGPKPPITVSPQEASTHGNNTQTESTHQNTSLANPGTKTPNPPPTPQASSQTVSTAPQLNKESSTMPVVPKPPLPPTSVPNPSTPQVSSPSIQPNIGSKVSSSPSSASASPQPVPVIAPGSNTAPAAAQVLSSGSGNNKSGLMKFVGIFVLVLMLGIGGYAAYQLLMNRQGTTESGPVTLRYWGLWEPQEVMAPLIAEYEQANPNVKIEYINSSPIEYSQRLKNALNAEKSNDDTPDLFRMHNTWVYMLKDDLAPLPSDIYPEEQYKADFWTINQNLKVGNEYYAIPLMYEGLGLYYNVDIFNTANKQPPTDWVTFQEVAQELTAADEENGILVSGAAMGLAHNVNHWPDILGVLMLQNRANPNNPNNKVAYDSLTFYSLFTYRYKTWSADMLPSSQAFATGRLAMMFGPSWEVFNIKKLAQQNGSEVNFKIIPIPQLPETNVTWASYWVEGVAKNSPHQREAWQFLKFLSQKESMRALIQEQSKIREFGEIPSRPDLAEEFKDHEYMGPYILQAPAAKSHFMTSNTTDETGLNARFIKYYEDAVNQASKGDAPSRILPDTAAGINEVLRDYGLAQ